ncbi:MAG: hypothetical protein LBU32_18180 [Clostridiales bacterium]|jgi:hypothetical protein|nr:hypothetical protein [Clostridiales bacterium]
MANAVKIRKTMLKQGIAEEIARQFDFPDVRGSYAPILPLVAQMDELLTPDQCLAIMQEQGCSITGKPDKAYRAFGKENADKTVAERIPLLDDIDTVHKYNVRLNLDGTLSVWWGEQGYDDCPCPVVKDVPRPRLISKTHCACCGGHARHHLQNGLGVKLKLQNVVSSSASSDGKERCEFLFEIVEGK